MEGARGGVSVLLQVSIALQQRDNTLNNLCHKAPRYAPNDCAFIHSRPYSTPHQDERKGGSCVGGHACAPTRVCH